MPKQLTTDELIEASRKARAELREALASLFTTIDMARDRFQQIKEDDLNARMQPEDKKDTLP
jgi:hypothetical protein